MQLLPEPGRLNLPHLPPLQIASVIQFVTVCVAKRRPLMANRAVADLIVDSWRKAGRWCVGRYVVMPDHLHFFCAPVADDTPLEKWMSFWRNDVTRRWPCPDQKPVWQRDYFDRQLRSGESYEQKWLYVRENPCRSNLVEAWDEWPFQGELNRLHWSGD